MQLWLDEHVRFWSSEIAVGKELDDREDDECADREIQRDSGAYDRPSSEPGDGFM